MQDIQITIIGNLTADPELRYTPSGQPVTQVRLAQTPRVKQGDQWVDGETTFLWATAWGELAEHIAESLARGTRVIATGTLRTERWKKDSEQRETIKVLLDGIGPDLRFATAQVRKTNRATPATAGQPDADTYHQAVQNARQQLGATTAPSTH